MDDLCNLFIVAMLSSPLHFSHSFYLWRVPIASFIFHSHFLFTAESVEFLLQFRFKATLILCADGHAKMHGSYIAMPVCFFL